MRGRTGNGIVVALAIAAIAGVLGLPGANGAAPPAQSAPAAQSSTPARPEVLVVRVPFHSVAERDRLAAEWSADEMDTQSGYLTFWTDRPTYNQMLAKGLQPEIDKTTTAQANSPMLFGQNSPDSFDGGYRTVEEMQSFLDSKVAAYPTLAEKIDVGNSWCKDHLGSCTQPNASNGYDLWALHITNRNIAGPKPVFWYDAGIHSREIATPEVAMRYINWLLDGYNSDPDAHWLVDYQDIWVMPMLNPDGHHIVEAGGSSPYYQRKNANKTNGCTQYPPSSSSQFGTDLNRNFPFLWGCCSGSSTSPCAADYRGPAAASDTETGYITAKIRSLIADQRGPNNTDAAAITATGIVMGMHSYANLNLYPWGWTTSAAPNNADLANIAKHMSATNAYPVGNGYQACAPPNCLYAVDGDSLDWAYGELGAAAFTTELEGGSFFPAYSTIDSAIWPHNQGMLAYMAKIARTPYLTTHGPDAKSVAVSPSSVAQGSTSNLTASLSSAWTGNTYNGTVAAGEYYVDTPPWAGGTAIALSGSFTSSTVAAGATVSTGSLSVGRHVVFVRGRSATSVSGNLTWGPITAVFLTVTSGGGPTNTPTATPPGPTNTPTNTPTPPPGPPNTPTVTPTPGACTQQVSNGGFETGSAAPWVQSSSGGYNLIDSSKPHSGTYGAYLGGYNNGTDTLYQQVSIPSTATAATLTYWWQQTTQETGSTVYDKLTVQVLNTAGTVLGTLQTVSNASPAGTWTQSSYSLLAYKGQTVRVQFKATTDASLTTSFYVDDVGLLTCP
ncbi:MAG: choice-of-anchor J domain-containing protein [Chloroflexota bacterium]|nr:choice-of-anchor J domain-containing protein [Chloroflexota bacterium]